MLYETNKLQIFRMPLESRRDFPLNAELNEESASGELAERVWDDPGRDEHSD